MIKSKRPSKPIGLSGQAPPFPRRAGLCMALGLTALSPGAALAAFPANLDLSTLDGTNGFRILGVMGGDPETNGEGSDRSGYAVGTAGDINGDGMDDLLIGAGGIIRNRPCPDPPPPRAAAKDSTALSMSYSAARRWGAPVPSSSRP